MTVTVETARVRYAGNGVTTHFAVPWYFLNDSDLRIVRRDGATGIETGMLLNFDYTVSGAGNPVGGAIDVVLVMPVGDSLAIFRNETVVQEANYVDNDSFPAETHERALDRLTMFAAAAKDRFSRTLALMEADDLMGGKYYANDNRITGVDYPVNDTDAATKVFVKDMISSALSGAPVDLTPQSGVAQWNANKIQSRNIANIAPLDGQALVWVAGANRWEPRANSAIEVLLGQENTFLAHQIFAFGLESQGTLFISGPGGGASGILDFYTNSGRITGIFDDTPYSNRTMFANRTVNKSTRVGAVPTGAGRDAAWECFGATDPNNAPIFRIAVDSVRSVLETNKTGGGLVKPLEVYAGAFNPMRFQTNGRIGVNTTVDNGAQVNCNGFITRKAGAFRAHRNGVAWSVVDSTFTSPNFTTEEYDDSGWFDLASDRYTPLIAGKYVLCGGTGPDGAPAGAGKRHQTGLYKNGVLHRLLNNQQTGGGNSSTACGAAIVDANGSTDYFEIYVWHNFGVLTSYSGLAMDCFFEGAHIG
jgi:hypothetical protein